ncbi:MAG: hypothetical protein ABSB61_04890 [Anaerolineales bacterium]|jgi:hypothetical protein
MPLPFVLPENCKIFSCYPRVTTGATIYPWAAQYVSLKLAEMVWILCNIQQATAATLALTIEQATNVAGGGSKVITKNIPIWRNLDTLVNDTFVRDTDAVGYTTDAGIKNKAVLFQLDPGILDSANGFYAVVLKSGAGAATTYLSVEFIILPHHRSANPPSVMVD